jgi:putative phosphoribosyl transferase
VAGGRLGGWRAGAGFADRAEAGAALGTALAGEAIERPVVLALPRGGVPVGAAVAGALGAPLDVLLVVKLGVPTEPELALGAVGEGGVEVLDRRVLRVAGVHPEEVAVVRARARALLDERAQRFRGGRPPPSLAGRSAVIVDDGVATGSTAAAACQVARALGARAVVVAVPVGARRSLDALSRVADAVHCLVAPEPFLAVGSWYWAFPEVSDGEVRALLEAAAPAGPNGPDGGAPPGRPAC